MGEWTSNWIAQLRALPPARQALLGVTAALSLAFFFWIAARAAEPQYRVLYRGLEAEEAAHVADALITEKIEYQLEDGGTSVLVPAGQVYEARIRLAGRSLPSGSGAGFELFDQPAFGVTDFVHRVNYARAVQGELARSIEQLQGVHRARVQVVIPERRSVLASSERHPSAAVVLRLSPGAELRPAQVRAVVHLVASSVESLHTDDVTVVDGTGRLLAPLEDGVPDGSLAAGGAPGYQQRVEHELAQRIEAMLEKTVGPGGVVARVRADMDWTESETTEEIYDPDSQVARSEQRSTEETSEASLGAGGVPGVVSNSPDAAGAATTSVADAGSSASRIEETVNYEISKTVSRRLTPMGRIERLSVAVLVADRPANPGEEATAWDADSLALFGSLAKQAVGFDEERGDQISVNSAPFRLSDPGPEPAGPWLAPEWVLLLATLARGAAVLLALVLFARLVVRPALGALDKQSEVRLPARVSELEAEMAGALPGAGAQAPVPEQAGQASNLRTEEGVRTLRNWLNQG
jgi:flagellar M-ring protein FliF